MADLNFPNSPVDGQEYEGYIFDGANSVWIYIAQSVATNNEIARVTAAFNKANTALANTSGIWFNGNLNIGSATSNVYLGDFIAFANLGSAVSNSNSGVVINQTWNGTDKFTAFRVNVSNTNSGTGTYSAGSLLANFQVDGVNKVYLNKDGYIYAKGFIISEPLTNGAGVTWERGTAGRYHLKDNSSQYNTEIAGGYLGLAQNNALKWAVSGGNSMGVNQIFDLSLYRDAANTLAQRIGGFGPQAYRLYNSYYDSANNERLAIQWQANTINISSEALGNGVIRPLAFTMNTNTVMYISNTGNVGIGRTDPSYSLDVVGTVNASAVLVNGSPISGGSGGGYFQGNRGDIGSTASLGDIFRVHTNILSQNVTIYSGNNAVATGPLSIASGKVLTIQSGARVSIV